MDSRNVSAMVVLILVLFIIKAATPYNLIGVSDGEIRKPLDSLIKAVRVLTSTTGNCPRIVDIVREAQGGIPLLFGLSCVGPTNTFRNVRSAIIAAPKGLGVKDGYYVIYVREGLYQNEQVLVQNANNILLIGAGIDKTIITGHLDVEASGTTSNSASFAVPGNQFVAVGVTFKNTAGPKMRFGQAVALLNNFDQTLFYRCSFESFQDTLYAKNGEQFYLDCSVYGTVDFVFGDARAFFQCCGFYARKPPPLQQNVFTAQGRIDPSKDSGFFIKNCAFKAAADLARDPKTTSTYLGRPWKVYARTVIMRSFIDALVDRAGWLKWNDTARVDKLYYAESGNYGPGSDTSGRVRWPGYRVLNASDAAAFDFTIGKTIGC